MGMIMNDDDDDDDDDGEEKHLHDGEEKHLPPPLTSPIGATNSCQGR